MARNTYQHPVDLKSVTRRHFRKNLGAHRVLREAKDYIVPERTPVLAALDGTVVYVKQDSNETGTAQEYWFKGNRIVLQHNNGEYSAYEHLKHNGATVKVGQKVRTGQIIGYSGNTGYSTQPHLHFEVFKNPVADKSEGDLVPITFAKKRQDSAR